MVDTYTGFSFSRLEHLLSAIGSVKVALIGDACLDVYWEADMTLSELSRETPHFPLPVVEERMSGGAGANTALNFAALGVASVTLISAIGKDWRADQLLKVLQEAGVSTEYILSSPDWVTPAYCKPRRHGISEVVYEDPRIDFENRKPLPDDEAAYLGNLAAAVTVRKIGITGTASPEEIKQRYMEVNL